MSGLVRSVVTAWEFLTAIPLSRRLPSPQDVGRSIIFFPLIGALIGPALVLMPAMGRWAMVTAGLKARPAGPDTEGVPSRLGAGFIRAVSWLNWAGATAILASFCFPICVLGLPRVGLTACLFFLVVIVGSRLFLVRRFGGLSGDMLGAIGEASEAAFLVGLLLGPP